MKVFLIILIIGLLFIPIAESQSVLPQNLKVCYGNTAQFELKDYFEGDAVSWEYSYDQRTTINFGSSMGNIVIETNTLEKKVCYIRALVNQKPTLWVKLEYHPDFSFDFTNSNLCENEVISFQAQGSNTLDYFWFIGNNLVGTGNKLNYFFSSPGNYSVLVTANDQNGCVQSITKQLSIPASPAVQIKTDDIFCSNGISSAELTGQTNSITSSSVQVLKNGIEVINYSVLKKNLLAWEVKWNMTNEPLQLVIRFNYTLTSGCVFKTEKNVLLVNNKSPDKGEIFRKSPKSSLLIYSDRGNSGSLNYLWGYTTDTGIEKTVGLPNRPYALFDNISTLNNYWVDVFYNENNYCKTRNIYDPITDPIYQVKSAGIKIYPNPVARTLNIVIENNPELIDIEIVNFQGSVLHKVQFKNHHGTIEMDLGNLPAGLYKLRYNDHQSTELIESILINN